MRVNQRKDDLTEVPPCQGLKQTRRDKNKTMPPKNHGRG